MGEVFEDYEGETTMKFPNYTLGLVTGFCLGCLYFMLPTIIKSFQEEPVEPPPKSNFEVVEQYKGCDVVRWTQSNFAEYKYFLHCASSQGGTQISQMP